MLLAELPGRDQSTVRSATRQLIATCGNIQPRELSSAHVQEADETIRKKPWSACHKAQTAASLRRILRWLWEEHGARKLDNQVRHYPTVRPRSVTVERAHFEDVLYIVPTHVRLWLLLCSDLAIRSGTAAALGPRHYNRDTATLQFTTKKQAKVHLPVTAEIKELIERCDLNLDVPFVRQLWQPTTGPAMRADTTVLNMTMSLRATMCRALANAGLPHTFIPHDLRRTTAVAMLEATHDIRDVQALLGHSSLQSTIWYLDHDLRPIKRGTLELIKRPAWRKEQTA